MRGCMRVGGSSGFALAVLDRHSGARIAVAERQKIHGADAVHARHRGERCSMFRQGTASHVPPGAYRRRWAPSSPRCQPRDGSNPSGCAIVCEKLRTTRPAPTSVSVASVTSPTTRAMRERLPMPGRAASALLSRCRSRRFATLQRRQRDRRARRQERRRRTRTAARAHRDQVAGRHHRQLLRQHRRQRLQHQATRRPTPAIATDDARDCRFRRASARPAVRATGAERRSDRHLTPP